MMELKGIQVPIRDRFYHHVGRIPGELSAVNESIEEDPYIDYGAPQLVLELSPRTAGGCRLKLSVNKEFCSGMVGKFGHFLLIRHMSDRPNLPDEYPDRVERIVKAVVYGGVVEEVWRGTFWPWKGKILSTTTWITGDGQKELLSSDYSWLWFVEIPQWRMSKETLSYESYVRQCGCTQS